MSWGIISWGWKGPFYVWSAEMKEEKAEPISTITELNMKGVVEEIQLNDQWRQLQEWKLLWERESDEVGWLELGERKLR
ncbi:hypothetical protein L873DRAFT_1920928 [Choiromyces venosus 120613-1]|uniref:Uncharacterized protein n=1 Tax=Choiromyces venosus 120613-1 TaxID=1336337 RepID=A0A3N4JFZ2_9PEZI|nr:hypothetical protein L873DRAFT_1920928 [Choiromyces venosus 120613-1]